MSEKLLEAARNSEDLKELIKFPDAPWKTVINIALSFNPGGGPNSWVASSTSLRLPDGNHPSGAAVDPETAVRDLLRCFE